MLNTWLAILLDVSMCLCHKINQYFVLQHWTHEHAASLHANFVLRKHQHKECAAETDALSSPVYGCALLQSTPPRMASLLHVLPDVCDISLASLQGSAQTERRSRWKLQRQMLWWKQQLMVPY